MPYWQRILITVVAIICFSWVVETAIETLIGFRLPGYIAGLVGGLAAVPAWELLRRVRPKS